MLPLASPRGTLRVEGKQNSLFLVGPAIKCFAIPLNSKIEKNYMCQVYLPRICCGFKAHLPAHVQVEVLSCCFPRELASPSPKILGS